MASESKGKNKDKQVKERPTLILDGGLRYKGDIRA